MKFQKRFVPLLLALVLALGTPPVQAAALTRGEAAQALLSAAQDYNPGVQRSDILKGYPDGSLALDGTLTRAQALVMLTRAFGGFAVPVGDNARMALPASSLTNVPACRKSTVRLLPKEKCLKKSKKNNCQALYQCMKMLLAK